ncbi:MAG: FtsQ-type POTRA domain-containing protein [Bacilli bacterium]|nr:FtsQ-type POTRA domain-containing protein [Bacilli bacterium]
MAKRKVKKRKANGKNIIIFLIIIVLIGFSVYYMYNMKIRSITVKGNTLYKDWEIIKFAGLDGYPSSMQSLSGMISHKLEKEPFIKKAKVSKKWLVDVNITIEENRPLFFYVPNTKTVLSDGTEIEDNFSVPTLVNYVPNKIYSKFLTEINNTDYNVVKRMSEIKYDPNDVDDERFLITMNDGNYVYLTLNKFNKINHYLEIIKEFNNKKGILYLDSGEYFKVA